MVGTEIRGCGNIVANVIYGLARHSENQVEVEAVETGTMRHPGGGPRLVGGMDTAEELENPSIERLCTEANAIDACSTEAGELLSIDRSGIGFEGDLDARVEPEEPVGGLNKVRDRAWLE